MAAPTSVTVCEDDLGSPCVGGTLSSPDIPGGLLPAGISFPVGPVDPAGPYVAGGPVGPYATLSPSDSNPAGLYGAGPCCCPCFSLTLLAVQVALLARMGRCPHLTCMLHLYVAGGPVGPDGTLSPFCSNRAGPAGFACGPVGPYGTLSPFFSDPAGFAGGPVGPDGTLSQFKSDPAGPDGSGGPVGPFGTLSRLNPDLRCWHWKKAYLTFFTWACKYPCGVRGVFTCVFTSHVDNVKGVSYLLSFHPKQNIVQITLIFTPYVKYHTYLLPMCKYILNLCKIYVLLLYLDLGHCPRFLPHINQHKLC